MSECPEWGPRDGHGYHDEDTGEYTGVCVCGHRDPALDRAERSSYVLTEGDEPPFI